MQDLIITTQGKDLITKLIASATKATFTRVVTSNKKYTNAQAGNLTTIQNIQQSKAIDSVYITSDTKLIEAYVKFDNTLVTSGYQVQTVGVYAQETGGTEILYAVSLADSNVDYMPAYDGNNPTTITFRLNVRVENNANVEITIDPAGSASNEALQAVKDSLTTTINSVNTTITTNLNNEITQRKADTSNLTTKLTTETNERKGADTSLQSNIDKEATTRASADTAINTKLDEIKKLSDLFYLDTPTGSKGEANINGQFINYFGRVKYKEIDINGEALPLSNIDDQDWVKRAVRILNKRMIDKQDNRGAAYCMGYFTPGSTWFILGSCTANTASTNSEGDPSYSNFIAFSYGAQSVRLFGTNQYVWSFDTLPLTSTVNALINNAKTALETAYKSADTQLQTDITTAYQQADTNLSNTLTQAYTDADTALRTELEGKIAEAGTANITEQNLLPLTSIKTQYDTSGAYIAFGTVTSVTPVAYNKHTLNADGTISTSTLSDTPSVGDYVTAYLTGSQKSYTDTWVTHAYIRDKLGVGDQWIFKPRGGSKTEGRALPFIVTPSSFVSYSYPNRNQYNVTVSYNTYLKVRLTGNLI